MRYYVDVESCTGLKAVSVDVDVFTWGKSVYRGAIVIASLNAMAGCNC
jgi:hypothetical protein